MVFLEAGIEAEGSLTQLAAVGCLAPATSCSVTAHMAVWTAVVWDGLRESPLLAIKWEVRVLRSMPNLCCPVIVQQPLCYSSAKLKLRELLL